MIEQSSDSQNLTLLPSVDEELEHLKLLVIPSGYNTNLRNSQQGVKACWVLRLIRLLLYTDYIRIHRTTRLSAATLLSTLFSFQLAWH